MCGLILTFLLWFPNSGSTEKKVPCPEGKHLYTNCTDPCQVSDDGALVCKSSVDAECRPEYCGGCIARFFDRSGTEIHCEEEEGYICEMKSNTISCAGSPGTTLNITHTNYGRTSKTVCEHPYGLERLHNNTNCSSPNSLSVVQELCQQRVSCTLTADTSLFGEDPCYGIYKYLEVDFECVESPPCPDGSHYFTNCTNPCLTPDSGSTLCKTFPDAECRPEYCGGCIARFFDKMSGKEIHCEEEQGFICELKANSITCAGSLGTTLSITYANYGRTSRTICEHPYGLDRLHNTTNCKAPGSLDIVKELCQDKISCTLKADVDIFGEDPCYGVYKYLEVDFECKKAGDDEDRLVSNRPSPSQESSLSHVLIPCAILAVLAICIVFTVVWRARRRRRRQGATSVSFVEMAEQEDEEDGMVFEPHQ